MTVTAVLVALAAALGCGVFCWPAPAPRRLGRREPAEIDPSGVAGPPPGVGPEVIVLVRLALGSGLSIGQTIATLAATWPHPALARAAERLRRGTSVAAAVDGWPEPVLSRLGELLIAAADDGLAVGAALEQVQDLARADRRRRAETAARSMAVWQLFPLVLCVFPAFVLLAVAPLIAGSLRSLAGAW